ncbi:hypothetical protein BTN49_0433 [Candidatus Enterovibrio escicola]|uniref:Uncharacterized protein n=1 Tax=Candidatus Enterovibrio escicola TaxID=1927127 RepID=A0A2A5T5L5_9GAMM|nr:hypothetical protein BTN49_0433 [Candidatus Enterovibrio escacola]
MTLIFYFAITVMEKWLAPFLSWQLGHNDVRGKILIDKSYANANAS